VAKACRLAKQWTLSEKTRPSNKETTVSTNNELGLDVGQANELKLAFRREGSWTNEEIKMLCEQKGFLTSVREVLLNRAEIKQVEYLVDMQSDPFTPDGWTVVEHRQVGGFKWDLSKVELYLDEAQKNGGCIEGNKLRKKLATKDVSNANLLDFLLKNTQLIPESWKGQYVFFWGTIYRNAFGGLCVRFLYWGGDRWRWRYGWLDGGWSGIYPAAVFGK
jgi:hypothetical protein